MTNGKIVGGKLRPDPSPEGACDDSPNAPADPPRPGRLPVSGRKRGRPAKGGQEPFMDFYDDSREYVRGLGIVTGGDE